MESSKKQSSFRPRFNVPDVYKKELASKHGLSMNSANLAWSYYLNSKKAREMRKEAISMLKLEVEIAEERENNL